MFESLQIKFLGKQPAAKISDRTLKRIIQREFGGQSDEATEKLKGVALTKRDGKNRVSVAAVKIANKNIGAIDDILNMDYRDILMEAEYPGCVGLGFGQSRKSNMKQICLSDWKNYSNWLNKK